MVNFKNATIEVKQEVQGTIEDLQDVVNLKNATIEVKQEVVDKCRTRSAARFANVRSGPPHTPSQC